jgi:hypothetical protein
MIWPEANAWSPQADSLYLISSKSRLRCRRVFEHFFRVQPSEVMESIIDCWYRDAGVRSITMFISRAVLSYLQNSTQQAAAFELIDALTSSAHTVVHMISESISCRIPGLSDKSRKQVINPNLSVM